MYERTIISIAFITTGALGILYHMNSVNNLEKTISILKDELDEVKNEVKNEIIQLTSNHQQFILENNKIMLDASTSPRNNHSEKLKLLDEVELNETSIIIINNNDDEINNNEHFINLEEETNLCSNKNDDDDDYDDENFKVTGIPRSAFERVALSLLGYN